MKLSMDRLHAERIAKELKFPEDFFDPPDPRPDEWADNPDLRRAVECPARSTTIIRAFIAYQLKNGIHISSFFITKQASGRMEN